MPITIHFGSRVRGPVSTTGRRGRRVTASVIVRRGARRLLSDQLRSPCLAARCRMIMPMVVAMIMVMMVDSLERTTALRVFVEHQGLDGDRHRIGRHPDAAEIDVIEIPQHY